MTQSDPLLIQTHPHHPPSAHHHFPLCLATENSFSSKKSPPVHSNAAPQDLSLKASMNQQQPHQKDLTMSPPVPAAPAQQLVQEGAGSSASSAAAAARAASLHSSLSSSPGSENYENLSFPKRLLVMLNQADARGISHIVRWQPEHQSFRVYDTAQFAQTVMPLYFEKQNRYKSFQRQLNLYGFKRIYRGPNKSGYYHKYFLQAHPERVDWIHRTKIKGKAPVNNASKKEPPVGLIQYLNNQSLAAAAAPLGQASPSVAAATAQQANIQDPMAALAHIATAGNTIPTNSDAVAQLPLSSVTQNATAVPYSGQHQAVDVRNFLEFMVQADHHAPTTTGTNTEAIPTQNQEPPFFPYKLYEMLEDAELQGFDSIVRWASAPVLGAADDDNEQPGLAFEVCKRQDFLKTILPRYFDLTKYESFRRQLNFYGFTRVPSKPGQRRDRFRHDMFRRDNKDLCQYITRANARKASGSGGAAGAKKTATTKKKASRAVTAATQQSQRND